MIFKVYVLNRIIKTTHFFRLREVIKYSKETIVTVVRSRNKRESRNLYPKLNLTEPFLYLLSRPIARLMAMCISLLLRLKLVLTFPLSSSITHPQMKTQRRVHWVSLCSGSTFLKPGATHVSQYWKIRTQSGLRTTHSGHFYLCTSDGKFKTFFYARCDDK